MDGVVDDGGGLGRVKALLESGDLIKRHATFAGNVAEADGVPGVVIIITMSV